MRERERRDISVIGNGHVLGRPLVHIDVHRSLGPHFYIHHPHHPVRARSNDVPAISTRVAASKVRDTLGPFGHKGPYPSVLAPTRALVLEPGNVILWRRLLPELSGDLVPEQPKGRTLRNGKERVLVHKGDRRYGDKCIGGTHRRRGRRGGRRSANVRRTRCRCTRFSTT